MLWIVCFYYSSKRPKKDLRPRRRERDRQSDLCGITEITLPDALTKFWRRAGLLSI